MTDIEALKARLRTLIELSLAELDGDLFTLVIHLEEAVKTAEELEGAIMGPEEDALVEPEDVVAQIRETFELETLDHVDIKALGAWTATGISLFPYGRLPKLSFLVDEARRVLVTRAHQLFGDNITHVAEAMSTSRRTARILLQRYGLKEPGSRCSPRIAPGDGGVSSRFPPLRLLRRHEQISK